MRTITQQYCFYILNLAGWLFYYIILSIFSPFYLAYLLPDRIKYLLPSLILIFALTTIYRGIYKYFEFDKKSLLTSTIQVIIGTIAIWYLDILLRFNFLYNYILNKIAPNLEAVVDKTPYGRVLNFMGEKIDMGDADWVLFYDAFVNMNQLTKFTAILIWLVIYNFIHYNKRFQETKYANLIAENELKKAQLANLQSQLNPHFVFNALNSIHALSLLEKDSAPEAILNLSDLMRYTLNYENKNLVTLKEELITVKKYLSLEKIRFDSRLNYSLAIDDDTLDKKIPPIVIQTLTENAIKHGISKLTRGGEIHIKTYLNEDFLNIEITNSGQINKENTPSVSLAKSSGIGIENSKKRLAMIFGDLASLSLKNIDNERVMAKLQIPITI